MKLPEFAGDVVLKDSIAVIGSGAGKLRLVSLADPAQPSDVGEIPGAFGDRLAISDSGIVVTSSLNGAIGGIHTTSLGADCDVAVASLAPNSELVLGKDLTINYQIGAARPDSAELRITNAAGIVVFRQPVAASSGTRTATWPKGRWNQLPHIGAFANPKNGEYKVAIVGVKNGTQCVEAVRRINTRLVLEADIKDEIPTGATATEAAGLGDLLDALKVIMKRGSNETRFAGPGNIAETGPNRFDRHVRVDAAGLNQLMDGDYEVLFQDLRDEIGNFSDADTNATNGIQPVKFNLSLW
jgi:hypothetical protein